jgi:hypothetical protein
MNAGASAVGQVPQLLAANIILPVQIAHPPAGRWVQRLYVAILEDALACLEGKGSLNKGRRDAVARRTQEAWEWLLSDAEHCFSFLTVCSVLDLNVEAVRREIRQRVAQGRARS